MRKKTVILAVVFLVLFLTVPGCSGKSDYEIYKEAAKRTGDVKRGRSETNMTMKLKFNKGGFPEEVYEGLRLFEDVALRFRSEYDREKEESLRKIFARTRDIGLDAKVYTKGEEIYIITPLIPKILVIRGDGFAGYESIPRDYEPASGDHESIPRAEYGIPVPSEGSLGAIEKIWEALYNDENVCALNKIVLNTPEGNVKATKYEIKLTDEQLKPALKKTMEVLSKDESFMGAMEDMLYSVENIMDAHMDAIDNSTVKTFNQTAFINRDNYIIEENLEMEILYHFTGEGTPKSYYMNMETRNWDLNRKQDIYFPEITRENSITLKELNDEYGNGLNPFRGETEK